jgi:hypothetical protein
MASTCAPESAWCNTELMKFILYLLAPFYKLRAKVLELRLLSLFRAPTANQSPLTSVEEFGVVAW